MVAMTITDRREGKMGTSAANILQPADDLELETIRQRLAEADAGGRFVRHEKVLAWLDALSRDARPPKAITTR
jgi:predicted transcriptional regulator